MDVRGAQEKAAALLREFDAHQHGRSHRRALDLERFLRFLNDSGRLKVRVQHEGWLPPKTDGTIRRAEDRAVEIVVAPSSYVRERFTIAHELGHALFEHPMGSFRNELSTQGTEANERLANGFAAALLMPAESLTRDLETASLEALAEMYEVSVDAMSNRIESLRRFATEVEESKRPPVSYSAEPLSQPVLGKFDWDRLLGAVISCRPGRQDAHRYHRAAVDLLSAVFADQLVEPRIEDPIAGGTKRVDVRFVNAAEQGFFSWLARVAHKPAPTIAVECKNYAHDVGNDEVFQLASRLNRRRGVVGLLVCREVKNRGRLLERTRAELGDTERSILVLDDATLADLVKCARRGDSPGVTSIMIGLYLELVD